MKILITGGRGFIGRKLQKELEKDPKNKVCVLVLNKDKDPGDEKLRCVIVGDINNRDLDISEYDLIYHLAAIASPRVCEADKELAWKVNVEGTRNIAEKVRPGARMVFMSSAHVYENGEKFHKEDEVPDPQSFYGLTKLAAEEAVNYFSKARGVKRTIFRLFNSYSAEQPPGFIVPDVIAKYKAQKEVEIRDPDSEIDLVHVDDVVEVLASASRVDMDGTFNICSGKPMKIKEIYAEIRKYVGAKNVAEKSGGNGNARMLRGNNSKIMKFGFKFREFTLP